MKNCMFCTNISITDGGCGSSWTGCYSGTVSCNLGHDLECYSDNALKEAETIGRFVLIANKCPDYELSQEIKDMLNSEA